MPNSVPTIELCVNGEKVNSLSGEDLNAIISALHYRSAALVNDLGVSVYSTNLMHNNLDLIAMFVDIENKFFTRS